MGAMPKKMIAGTAVGLIGGIVALVAMFYAWNGTLESTTSVGLNMLVAVMFFGVAGCFTKYTPVPGATVLVLSAVCEAFVIIAMLYNSMELWMGAVLAVLGIVNILFAACPTVTKWVDGQRVI